MKFIPHIFSFIISLSLLPILSIAGPVDSGNEFALDFSTAKPKSQKEIKKDASGKLFFFRYLHISTLEKNKPNTLPYIKMSTIEPSSDMHVNFTIKKRASLKKAGSLQVGDAIAVTGRIKSITKPSGKPGEILLNPVIVRYKDRLAPKAGKELLYEVDPNARKGTDTSGGIEKIKR